METVDQHSTAAAALTLALTVMVMINLMMYGVLQDHRKLAEKVSQQLYTEKLKRDYFEWRESNATGHSVDRSEFPRAAELEAANRRAR